MHSLRNRTAQVREEGKTMMEAKTFASATEFLAQSRVLAPSCMSAAANGK
jgi:hypothetical protein